MASLIILFGLLAVTGTAQSASPPLSSPTDQSLVSQSDPLMPGLIGESNPFTATAAAPGSNPESLAQLRDQYEDIQAKERKRKAWLAGDEAKDEREKSRDAYGDSDDEAAVRLLKDNFAEAMKPQQPDTETLLGGGTVKDYLDERVAVVESPDQKRFLIDSQVPLRTDDPHKADAKPEPVDLDLVKGEDGFVPDAGVARVTLPEKAQEGIAIGPAVVKPEGAGDVARVDSDTMAYPNIETDTDLAVSVTRDGFRTFHQVRGPDAPEEVRLKVALPPGTELVKNDEGAKVVRHDTSLMTISPPRAADAQGKNVPTSLEVDGDWVVIKTPHRGKDVAYPLLVDPDWEVMEDWACGWQNGCSAVCSQGYPYCQNTWFKGDSLALSGLQYWTPYMYGSANWGASLKCLRYGTMFDNCYGPAHGGGPNWGGTSGWSNGNTGLNLWAGGGNYYPAGQFYEYVYVPAGTTTRVNRADFGAQFMRRGWDTGGILMFNALYSYATNNWVPGASKVFDGSEDGSNDWALSHHWNQHQGWNTPGPQGVAFGITNVGGGLTPSYFSTAYLGGAIIHLTDPEAPTLSSPSPTGATGTNGWAKSGDILRFSAAASDPGMGVRRFRLTRLGQSANDPPIAESGVYCNGTRSLPCAAQADLAVGYTNQHGTNSGGQSHAAPFAVPVNNLPEGSSTLIMKADDALGGPVSEGHATERTHPVKVDKADPSVTVEGTLRPEDRDWVGAGKQTLVIDGTDSGSGIVSAVVKIDGQTVGTPFSQTCAEGGCPLEWDPDINTDDLQPSVSGNQPLTEGPHTVSVVATDAAGRNSSPVSWNIRHDRVAPSLTVSGTLKDSAGQPLNPAQTYSVQGNATDAASGLGEVTVHVDETPDDAFDEQECLGGGCSLQRSFSYVQDDYGPGEHVVDVIATDRAGNQTTERVNAANAPPSEPTCPAAPSAASEQPASTVTPASALSLIDSAQGLPKAVSNSSAIDLNGTTLDPALALVGGLFKANDGLSQATVRANADKGASWTVPTSQGPVCLTPLTVGSDASAPVAPSAGDGVMFANSRAATDSVLRATPVGLQAFQQLRGPSAPEQFSWKVDVPEGTELRELSDGSVAVVQPAQSDVTAPAPLDDPPPAAQSGADKQAQVGDTQAELTAADDDRTRLERPLADVVEAVIRKPSAKDAAGDQLATTLSASGSTLTLTVPHQGANPPYPVIAETAVSDISAVDEGSSQKSMGEATPMTDSEAASYDTSGAPEDASTPGPATASSAPDDNAAGDYADDAKEGQEFGGGGDAALPGRRPDAEARAYAASAFTENLSKLIVGFSDSNAMALDKPDFDLLSDKNPSNKQYIRVFVPWNYTAIKKRVDAGSNKVCERRTVGMWDGLGASPGFKDRVRARTPAVKNRTSIMVVFSPKPPPGSGGCKIRVPGPTEYRNHIREFLRRNRFVKQITAWNEPNFNKTPATRAADYWRKAQAFCNDSRWCGDVPAGDFAGGVGKDSYFAAYRRRLMNDLGDAQKPRIWSFHAYGDGLGGAIRGRITEGKSNTMTWRRRYSKPEYRRGNTPPAIWNTEMSAFYRVDCSKLSNKPPKNTRNTQCGKVNAQGQPASNGDTATALRVGHISQARAAAQFIREAVKPVAGVQEVSRLYYYELQSAVGYQYENGGAGQSGRCTLKNGVTVCNEMDSGILGAVNDGPGVPTDKKTRVRAGATTTPNARRRIWCLLKLRRSDDIKNGSVRQRFETIKINNVDTRVPVCE